MEALSNIFWLLTRIFNLKLYEITFYFIKAYKFISVTFIFLTRIILTFSIEKPSKFSNYAWIKYLMHKTDSGLESRGVKFL
jgi:hypothetical protein